MTKNLSFSQSIFVFTPHARLESFGESLFFTTGDASLLLVEKGNQVFTFKEGDWLEVSSSDLLTEDLFKRQGILNTEAIPKDKLKQLGDFRVLLWTSIEDISSAKILTERDVPENISLEMNMAKTSGTEMLNKEDVFDMLTVSESPVEAEIERLNNTEIRYQLSVDEINWYGYENSWNQTKLMTKEEVSLLDSETLSILTGDEIHSKGNFYIKSILTSDNEDVYPTVEKVKFTFVENKEPVIQNLSVSFGEKRGESVKTEFFARDKEGDKMQYLVSIKKAGQFHFDPLSPKWVNITKERNEFYFDFATLSVGRNEVKVEVKDSRGLITSSSAYIMLINRAPFNLATYHDSAKVTGVIHDPEGDLVTYDVYLDGELIREGTDYLPQPRTFHYEWPRNKIVPGKFYQVKMVFKDIFGASYETQFKIIGSYRGVMFSDEFGYYYTDDKLNLLEWLDLGDVDGNTTGSPKRVYIENHCGFPADDVTIEVGPTRANALVPSDEGEDHIANTKIELSLTENPFVPLKSIKIPKTMPMLTREPFFVRVKAGEHARGPGQFRIKASAKDGSI